MLVVPDQAKCSASDFQIVAIFKKPTVVTYEVLNVFEMNFDCSLYYYSAKIIRKNL